MDTLKFNPSLKLTDREAVKQSRARLFAVLARLMTDQCSLVRRDITIGTEKGIEPHNFYKNFKYEFVFPPQKLGLVVVRANGPVDPDPNHPENKLWHHVMEWNHDTHEVQGALLVEYDDSLTKRRPYLTITDVFEPADSLLPARLEPVLTSIVELT